MQCVMQLSFLSIVAFFIREDKGVCHKMFEHFPKVPNYKTTTLELIYDGCSFIFLKMLNCSINTVCVIIYIKLTCRSVCPETF